MEVVVGGIGRQGCSGGVVFFALFPVMIWCVATSNIVVGAIQSWNWTLSILVFLRVFHAFYGRLRVMARMDTVCATGPLLHDGVVDDSSAQCSLCIGILRGKVLQNVMRVSRI